MNTAPKNYKKFMYVVFDGIGSSINRKNLIPEYKSGRNVNRINANIFDHIDDENESKADQIGRLIQYLRCLPIKILSIDKVEADDIIAFLSTEMTKNEKTKDSASPHPRTSCSLHQQKVKFTCHSLLQGARKNFTFLKISSLNVDTSFLSARLLDI